MENYINYLKKQIAFYDQARNLVKLAMERADTSTSLRFAMDQAKKSVADLRAVYNKIGNISEIYQQLLNYAELPDEEYIKILKLYGPFKEIFYCLDGSNLTPYDKLSVVEHFVNINVAVLDHCVDTHEFYNERIIDLEKLRKYSFKTITEEELRSMIESGGLLVIGEKDEKDMTDRERDILKELQSFYERYPVAFEDQCELYNRFKSHYTDKKDCFDLDDIACILTFLQQVDIPEHDIENIHKYLLKDYYHRQSRLLKNQQKNSIQTSIPEKQPKAVPNNRRSYKEIIHEIKSLYDNGEFTHPLTRTELYYLLSLMLDVSYPQETIIKVIEMWYNEQKRNNVFTEYLLNYDRYAYYAPRQHYEADLSFLDEIFKSVFIANDEDYENIKQYMFEECTRMDAIISSKYQYDYELAQAKKLLNQKGN